MLASALLNKIESSEFTLGVVGLGYVGLPLAMGGLAQGVKTIGFDINQARVDDLMAGKAVFTHLDQGLISEALETKMFEATTDMSRMGEPDVIAICVPTPLTRHREPDLKYVTQTVEAIAASLRPGQLILLESTTYPGTTRELVAPILEKSGLKKGEEFFLGFAPEREDPGNESFTSTSIPKVLGADDDESRKLADAFYRKVFAQTVPVSSTATSEAVKITENIFRAVNIALVNELKVIFAEMDIDVWEVIEAAKTKPFGYMPFYPGPGLGGHCIPIDPFYLSWKAKEFGLPARFIELAGEVNTQMPKYIVDKLIQSLDDFQKKSINGANILVLGVSYKKNIDDIRESPSLRIMELLEGRGANVDYSDPYIDEIPQTREYSSLKGKTSKPTTSEALAAYDAVLLCTDHDDYDYDNVVNYAKLIIDSRNAFGARGLTADHIVKA